MALNISLTGTEGNDSLTGEAGNDTLIGGGGDDTFTGGAGNDTFQTSGVNTVTITDLGNGLDVLTVYSGNGTANATLAAAWTASSASYNNGKANLSTAGYAVNLSAITNGNYGFKVTNTGGATTLTGSFFNDTLIGGEGNDTLKGGPGSDQLTGGGGANTFEIDSGSDSITDLKSVDVVKVSSGASAQATIADSYQAVATNLTISGTLSMQSAGYAVDLSSVVSGTGGFQVTNTSGGTSFKGSSLSDLLYGATGSDSLDGGAGNDTLIGGGGDDTFTGGAGNDTFQTSGVNTVTITDLGNGLDVLTVYSGNGTANATLAAAWTASSASYNNGKANLSTAGYAVNLSAITNGNYGFKVTNTGGATTLTGSFFNDTLIGGEGNDTLKGGPGSDQLTGGGGANTFEIDSGSDSITDLKSVDVVKVSSGASAQATIADSYQAVATNLTISGTLSMQSAGYAVDLSSVVSGTGGFQVTNTSGGTSFKGSSLSDLLYGATGSDSLDGGAGNDTLIGGGGDDTFTGGAGNDTFQTSGVNTVTITDLGNGLDVLTVYSGNGTANATLAAAWTASSASYNNGKANLSTAGYAVNLSAITNGNYGFKVTNTGGATTLTGSFFNDTLIGGEGNDTLKGGPGSDQLTGGGGANTFEIDSGSDSITDLKSVDVVKVSSGASAQATIADSYQAVATNLTISGTLSMQSAGYAVDLSSVVSGTGGFQVTNTSGGTSFKGSSLSDLLYGATGSDSLDGGAGNDTLIGGGGDDTFTGGAGNDTFQTSGVNTVTITDLGNGLDVLTVYSGNGTANATLAAAWTASSASYNNGKANLSTAGYAVNLSAITNGNYGFKVTNTGGATTLTGSFFNDTLIGGEGNDTLKGGPGSDQLTGGGGANTFEIDSGSDSITDLKSVDVVKVSSGASAQATIADSYQAVATNLTISGTLSMQSAGYAVDLSSVVSGTGGFQVTNTSGGTSFKGSSLSDLLYGATGSDSLDGGAGNDTLIGGGGDDTFTGGAGNDTFQTSGVNTVTITDLGNGLDVLTVYSGNGTANATLAAAWTASSASYNNGKANLSTAGYAVNLSAITNGNYGFKVTNTGGATTLTGSFFNDTLIGGEGNDTLKGGGGNDTLTGGGGEDLFLVSGSGVSTSVTDFSQGDQISISGATITGLNIQASQTILSSSAGASVILAGKFLLADLVIDGGVVTLTRTADSPTYTLTSSQTSVNEGSSATFTLTTTNLSVGSSVTYTLSGISTADVVGGALTGSVVIDSAGKGTITIPLAADVATEGDETLTVTVQGKTASVAVKDTSVAPLLPTYALSTTQSNVNEGASASFELVTTNVTPGTAVAYTLSGISTADVVGGALTGSVVIDSAGKGTITIPLAADVATEGDETLTITVQGKTASVVVKDTSVAPLLPTYALSTTQSNVNEGASASFELVTTNVTPGTAVAYTLSGISTADVVGGALTGSVVIDSAGKGTISIPLAADVATEGDETLTITVQGKTASVVVKDTSVAPLLPTYALSTTQSNVNEGASASFELVTTNVTPGTAVAYTLSGISTADVVGGALTGSVVIDSAGKGTISIPLAADVATEGDETLTITVQGKTASVVVKDTSVAPLLPTYALSTTQSNVNEGASASFELVTTNVTPGTAVAYTLSGISTADVVGGALTGSVVIDSAGKGTISIPLAADVATEGDETLTITVQGKTASVVVKDTSVAPLLPTYALSTTQSNVNEGASASFELVTTNVTPGTAVAYTLSGISTADVVGGALTGSVVIDSAGKGTISIPIAADRTAEGDETLTVTVEGKTASVAIKDTSTNALGSFGLLPAAATFNEGANATFYIVTDTVSVGLEVPYAITGVSASDVVGGQLSGTAVIGSNGEATIAVPLAADRTTEGDETLTVTVQGKTSSVTVKDTSTTPPATYDLKSSASTVDEGSAASFVLTTQNVAANTVLAYTISGLDKSDITGGALTGSVTVGSDGIATLSVPLLADQLTEGEETLTVSLKDITGVSASVKVQDTSLNPKISALFATPSAEVAAGKTLDIGTHELVLQAYTPNPTAGSLEKFGITGRNIMDAFNLYGILGRDPDPTGLGYWIEQIEEGRKQQSDGIFNDAIFGFISSAEFTDSVNNYLKGSTKSFNRGAVEMLYHNVLERDWAQIVNDPGVGYLASEIDNGNRTLVSVAKQIVISAEAYNHASYVINKRNISFVTWGTLGGNHAINGTDGPNALDGGDGNDTMSAAAGNDVVRGFGGDDFLVGGLGDDSISGGTGNDTVSFEANYANFDVSFTNGSYRVKDAVGALGTDQVTDVEWFKFLDRVLPAAQAISPLPTYAVSTTQSSLNEGQTAVFSITTQNVRTTTDLTWQITGLAKEDIEGGALTGTVRVDAQGKATVMVTIRADLLTENTETLNFTLGGKSASIAIADTSPSPDPPTYAIAANQASVNEGDTVSFTVTTTNVQAGTTLSYIVTGVQANDVTGGLSGIVQIDASGKATINVPTTADKTTEGDETLSVTLQSKSASVTLKDTSTDPTYAVAANQISVNEGGTATFIVTTTNVQAGTLLNYTLSGVSATDVVSGALSGQVTVGLDGTAIISVTLAPDRTTEGQETLTASVQGKTASTLIIDTSTDPTYAIAANQNSVNEGDTASFTVTTTNVASGTTLNYTITGVSATDITGSALSGTVQIGTDGRAQINVPIAADKTTEGPETMIVSLPLQGRSASTAIVDFSRADPTYAIKANQTSVNEGDTATFTVSTTNVPAGTRLSYTLGGTIDASDIVGELDGFVTIDSDGVGVITVKIRADQATEYGKEMLTVTVQGKSASTEINDTSLTPDSFLEPFSTTSAATIFDWFSTSGQQLVMFDNLNPQNLSRLLAPIMDLDRLAHSPSELNSTVLASNLPPTLKEVELVGSSGIEEFY